MSINCSKSVTLSHGPPTSRGKCPWCGEYLGRPRLQERWEPDLDDWSDPELIDRDPDDDVEGIVARKTTEHYGDAPNVVWDSTRGKWL